VLTPTITRHLAQIAAGENYRACQLPRSLPWKDPDKITGLLWIAPAVNSKILDLLYLYMLRVRTCNVKPIIYLRSSPADTSHDQAVPSNLPPGRLLQGSPGLSNTEDTQTVVGQKVNMLMQGCLRVRSPSAQPRI
jgi:hypothetical protein